MSSTFPGVRRNPSRGNQAVCSALVSGPNRLPQRYPVARGYSGPGTEERELYPLLRKPL